jgi:UDP-3-O-[3-hydroxymyristoyl] N-acetylglucosamine deacetylase
MGARSSSPKLWREVPSEAPRLAVERAGELACGASRYTFEPGDGIDVEVETIFDAPLGIQRARWSGEPARFLAEIAPARTFGFATQASALWSRGRGLLAASPSQVDANRARALSSAVLVFDEAGSVLPGTHPPRVNEVAHHKLLDLIGDFALYGGPPRGRIFATRPGHTASHQIIGEALSLGLLSRR